VALRPNSGSWPPLTGLREYSHCTHNSRMDASGRLIGPKQRPLPDNTQHSRETHIHPSGEIRTCNPSKQAAADRVATGNSSFSSLNGTSGFINSTKYLWVSVEFWSTTRSSGRLHKAAIHRSANPDNRIRIYHCCECRLSTCECRHFFYQFYVNKSHSKLLAFNFLNAIIPTLLAN
jgi:hypothetical protein